MKTLELDEAQNQIVELTEAVKHLLLVKNERYGNSMLSKPQVEIFGKVEPGNPLAKRLDEKLARVLNATQLQLNDVVDVVGYGILLMIQHGWTADEVQKLEED
jgi:hypothetical protein